MYAVMMSALVKSMKNAPTIGTTRNARGAGLMDATGMPRKVTWLRRLAVGADVVSIEPTLDATQARRLLDALEADPDVEYAEPDSRMTIGPGTDMPMRGPTVD